MSEVALSGAWARAGSKKGEHRMSSQPVYSQVFKCRHPRSSLGLEVQHVAEGVSVRADVEHRRAGEKAWARAGSFGPVSASGLMVEQFDGLKDEVRVAFTTDGRGSASPRFVLRLLPDGAEND